MLYKNKIDHWFSEPPELRMPHLLMPLLYPIRCYRYKDVKTLIFRIEKETMFHLKPNLVLLEPYSMMKYLALLSMLHHARE